MAIVALTADQKLAEADLEGSGASTSHAPELKEKFNDVVDKVNELVAIGSDDIANDSGVTGTTISDAIDQLDTDLGDRIEGSVAAVDLKDAGATDYTIALGGTTGKRFVPTKVAVRCKTATALTGDAKIKIGTALGGEQVAAEITLTGLNVVDEVYVATPADGVRAVAADATIHVQVSSPDSGTSGTADVSIIGFEV